MERPKDFATNPEAREAYQRAIYPEAHREAIRGHPRLFIESYFTIYDDIRKMDVPFLFTEPQAYIHDRFFMPLKSHHDPMVCICCLKPRKIRMTSLFLGVGTAMPVCVPGWHSFAFFQDERTGVMLNKKVLQFHRSLPDWMEDDVHLNNDTKTYKEWIHTQKKGGRLIEMGRSSMTIATANSEAFGRGQTPRSAHFSEYSIYENVEDFMTAVRNACPTGTWMFKEYTPFGTNHRSYTDYLEAKEGRGGEAVTFYWSFDRTSAIPEGHPDADPEDRHGITLTDEEEKLIESANWTTHENVSNVDKIRWRRTKLKEEIRNRRDKKLGKAYFLQEHMEDDVNCWANLSRMAFNAEVMTDMAQAAKSNLPRKDEFILPDFRLQVWAGPVKGRRYGIGMDTAAGLEHSDKTVIVVGDLDSGQIVATVVGKCGPDEAGEVAVGLAREYNDALLGIERTGGYGDHAVKVADKMGYHNVYKEPRKRGDSAEAYRRKPKGINMTKTSKATMSDDLVAAVNARDLWCYNESVIQQMVNWDPEEHAHTPDEVISMMLFQHLRENRPIQPRQEYDYKPKRGWPKLRPSISAYDSGGAHVWGVN